MLASTHLFVTSELSAGLLSPVARLVLCPRIENVVEAWITSAPVAAPLSLNVQLPPLVGQEPLAAFAPVMVQLHIVPFGAATNPEPVSCLIVQVIVCGVPFS